MLNVLRLTSSILKKFQLADLAKLFLISSSSTSNTPTITASSSLPQSQSDFKNCIASVLAALVIAERIQHQQYQQNQNPNDNLEENTKSTLKTSSSDTAVSTVTTLSQQQITDSCSGGVNNCTKFISKKFVDNSVQKLIIQNSSNNKLLKKSKFSENTVMSSKTTLQQQQQQQQQNGDCNLKSSNNCNDSSDCIGMSTSSPEKSMSSSCLKPSSSSSGKSCFTSSLSDILKFLELVGSLKHIKRTGWVLRDVKDCESISGHMYRMSMMTFLLDGTEGLNRTKCMELALVHDLAESLVGDITPFCGISKEEKKLRELKAMEDICKLIEPRGKRIYELFMEYEENETPESKFVKDLDRLDMVLQAFEYEKRDDCVLKHQEFFDSTDGKFSHPFVLKLVNEIYEQRHELAEKQKQKHEQQEQQKQEKNPQENNFNTSADTNCTGIVDENVVKKKISSS